MSRIVSLLAVSLLAACGGKDLASGAAYVKNEAPIVERETEDGLVEVQIDLDKDGKADIFNFYRPRTDDRLLVRKQVDLNHDGDPDVTSFFNESGDLEREEIDGDFDGRPDWIDHYQGRYRVMSEADSDHDGTFDTFSYYDEGRITRKERDTTGDGQIDYWERFDEDENVFKTGADIDGDGKVDIREE